MSYHIIFCILYRRSHSAWSSLVLFWPYKPHIRCIIHHIRCKIIHRQIIIIAVTVARALYDQTQRNVQVCSTLSLSTWWPSSCRIQQRQKTNYYRTVLTHSKIENQFHLPAVEKGKNLEKKQNFVILSERKRRQEKNREESLILVRLSGCTVWLPYCTVEKI